MPDENANRATTPRTSGSEASLAAAEPPGSGSGVGTDPESTRSSDGTRTSSSERACPGAVPSGSSCTPKSAHAAAKEPHGSDAPDLAGAVLGGKFRLIKRLSRGGMGSVWAAHHEALDTEVAVKILHRTAQGPTNAERFHREARAAARLGHPAIVRVLDYGHSDEGDPYIVMERLRGEDLRTRIGRAGQLPPVAAVRLLLPVAHAVAAAHEKGIVHRDIKPENIFLSVSQGSGVQPKLVDFGIATMTASSPLTVDSVLGSPGYMSPEQARGAEVDYRTDIWSFCVVLYEVLVGSPPFVGTNYNAVLREVIERDPVPLVSILPDQAELWDLMQRGLVKNRRERWPSIRILGIELAQWLMARGVSDDATNTSLQSTWMPVTRPSEAPSYVRTLSFDRPISGDPGAPSDPAKPSSSTPVDDSAGSEAPVSTPTVTKTSFGRTGVAWTLAALVAFGLAVAAAINALRPSSEPQRPAAAPSAAAQPSPARPLGSARQPSNAARGPESPQPTPHEATASPARSSQNAGSRGASAAAVPKRAGRPPRTPPAAAPKQPAGSSRTENRPAPPTQAFPPNPDPDTDTDLKTTF
ncbi:MAG: serine/threonine protein kinase [Polyangiaceae bacterium]|nr:serine/threonine protein kinase [Polyangiaceae bacterium]